MRRRMPPHSTTRPTGSAPRSARWVPPASATDRGPQAIDGRGRPYAPPEQVASVDEQHARVRDRAFDLADVARAEHVGLRGKQHELGCARRDIVEGDGGISLARVRIDVADTEQ